MKILILSPYPITRFASELGIKNIGFEHPYTWVTNLARHLAKIDNNEVHIMTMRRDIPRDITIMKEKIFYHFLTPPSRMFQYITLTYASLLKIRKIIREINPDIVHGQGTDRFSYFAIHSGYPNVITVHGVSKEFQYHLGKQKKSKELLLNLYLEKKCFKQAKYIICISPYLNKYFDEFKTKAKIYNIENPVHEIYFDKKSIPEENAILYIGSITPRKRFLDLLKAMTELKDVTLRVISFAITPESYKEEVMNYVKQNSLQDRVQFLGFMDEYGINNELRKAKLLVLTSGAETAPMSIAEAMAVGKPVIATSISGIPFMVEHEVTGFLYRVGDIDNFKNLCMKLFDNTELRQKMGINAKNTALKRFYPTEVSNSTVEVYKLINMS